MKKTTELSEISGRKAVLYARVSSKEQEKEGYSIPAQQKLIREYAAQQGLSIVHEYVDVETAKRTGRPGFAEMVSYFKQDSQKASSAGECRVLLVEKTDRLYRNLKDWVVIDDLDIEIHLVKENVILSADSRSSEKFMHGIKVLMAKNYIDNLSEETSKGMLEKAQQGIWPSFAPFGYLNIATPTGRRIIVPHPHHGPLVKLIFEWYATGDYSIQDINEKLNSQHAVALDGKRLSRSTIHKLLSNPIYNGEFVWDGVTYQGTHEPIVVRDLFDEVQEVLVNNGQNRKTQQKQHFLFQGLITCGHCGCAMVAEIKKGKYVYYHCTQNKGKCGKTYVREEELERQFHASLRAIHLDLDSRECLLAALRESHADKMRYHNQILASLQDEIKRLQHRLDAMYIDHLDGKVDPVFYEKKKREWRREQDALQRKMTRHHNADTSYIDEGVRLLELTQDAVITYKNQNMNEKRSLLKIVHSNSIWKDGTLSTEYRKPFDLLAVTNHDYQQKKVTFQTKSDLCTIWLPSADSNHGHGD